jgi:hypothetical protein
MVDDTLTQTETEQWVAMMSPIAEEIHALGSSAQSFPITERSGSR